MLSNHVPHGVLVSVGMGGCDASLQLTGLSAR
jgi:hypothetical protein